MTKDATVEGSQPLLEFPAQALGLGALELTSSNDTAMTIIRNPADWPTPALCLVGAPKAGKTTMARAWAADLGGEMLLPDQLDRMKHETLTAASTGLVVVDDADSARNEDNLLSLINLTASAGGRVLLTARSTPGGWRVKSADLASRLRSMPLAEIGPPDEAMLRGRLRAAGRRSYMRFSEELLDFLVVRLGRSYAGLEDYVTRLSGAVSDLNRAPTIPLARDVLQAGGAFEYAPEDEDEDDHGHV